MVASHASDHWQDDRRGSGKPHDKRHTASRPAKPLPEPTATAATGTHTQFPAGTILILVFNTMEKSDEVPESHFDRGRRNFFKFLPVPVDTLSDQMRKEVERCMKSRRKRAGPALNTVQYMLFQTDRICDRTQLFTETLRRRTRSASLLYMLLSHSSFRHNAVGPTFFATLANASADAHKLNEAVHAGKDAAFYVNTSEEYEDEIKAEFCNPQPRRGAMVTDESYPVAPHYIP
ncbi:hypothetical protein BJV78DRAFT_1150856 [Lactifluus subvellereus]|nr:hypothetical protein BJV78DRAFT_1150856 [Lactifluus subvellereus]